MKKHSPPPPLILTPRQSRPVSPQNQGGWRGEDARSTYTDDFDDGYSLGSSRQRSPTAIGTPMANGGAARVSSRNRFAANSEHQRHYNSNAASAMAADVSGPPHLTADDERSRNQRDKDTTTPPTRNSTTAAVATVAVRQQRTPIIDAVYHEGIAMAEGSSWDVAAASSSFPPSLLPPPYLTANGLAKLLLCAMIHLRLTDRVGLFSTVLCPLEEARVMLKLASWRRLHIEGWSSTTTTAGGGGGDGRGGDVDGDGGQGRSRSVSAQKDHHHQQQPHLRLRLDAYGVMRFLFGEVVQYNDAPSAEQRTSSSHTLGVSGNKNGGGNAQSASSLFQPKSQLHLPHRYATATTATHQHTSTSFTATTNSHNSHSSNGLLVGVVGAQLSSMTRAAKSVLQVMATHCNNVRLSGGGGGGGGGAEGGGGMQQQQQPAFSAISSAPSSLPLLNIPATLRDVSIDSLLSFARAVAGCDASPAVTLENVLLSSDAAIGDWLHPLSASYGSVLAYLGAVGQCVDDAVFIRLGSQQRGGAAASNNLPHNTTAINIGTAVPLNAINSFRKSPSLSAGWLVANRSARGASRHLLTTADGKLTALNAIYDFIAWLAECHRVAVADEAGCSTFERGGGEGSNGIGGGGVASSRGAFITCEGVALFCTILMSHSLTPTYLKAYWEEEEEENGDAEKAGSRHRATTKRAERNSNNSSNPIEELAAAADGLASDPLYAADEEGGLNGDGGGGDSYNDGDGSVAGNHHRPHKRDGVSSLFNNNNSNASSTTTHCSGMMDDAYSTPFAKLLSPAYWALVFKVQTVNEPISRPMLWGVCELAARGREEDGGGRAMGTHISGGGGSAAAAASSSSVSAVGRSTALPVDDGIAAMYGLDPEDVGDRDDCGDDGDDEGGAAAGATTGSSNNADVKRLINMYTSPPFTVPDLLTLVVAWEVLFSGCNDDGGADGDGKEDTQRRRSQGRRRGTQLHRAIYYLARKSQELVATATAANAANNSTNPTSTSSSSSSYPSYNFAHLNEIAKAASGAHFVTSKLLRDVHLMAASAEAHYRLSVSQSSSGGGGLNANGNAATGGGSALVPPAVTGASGGAGGGSNAPPPISAGTAAVIERAARLALDVIERPPLAELWTSPEATKELLSDDSYLIAGGSATAPQPSLLTSLLGGGGGASNAAAATNSNNTTLTSLAAASGGGGGGGLSAGLSYVPLRVLTRTVHMNSEVRAAAAVAYTIYEEPGTFRHPNGYQKASASSSASQQTAWAGKDDDGGGGGGDRAADTARRRRQRQQQDASDGSDGDQRGGGGGRGGKGGGDYSSVASGSDYGGGGGGDNEAAMGTKHTTPTSATAGQGGSATQQAMGGKAGGRRGGNRDTNNTNTNTNSGGSGGVGGRFGDLPPSLAMYNKGRYAHLSAFHADILGMTLQRAAMALSHGAFLSSILTSSAATLLRQQVNMLYSSGAMEGGGDGVMLMDAAAIPATSTAMTVPAALNSTEGGGGGGVVSAYNKGLAMQSRIDSLLDGKAATAASAVWGGGRVRLLPSTASLPTRVRDARNHNTVEHLFGFGVPIPFFPILNRRVGFIGGGANAASALPSSLSSPSPSRGRASPPSSPLTISSPTMMTNPTTMSINLTAAVAALTSSASPNATTAAAARRLLAVLSRAHNALAEACDASTTAGGVGIFGGGAEEIAASDNDQLYRVTAGGDGDVGGDAPQHHRPQLSSPQQHRLVRSQLSGGVGSIVRIVGREGGGASIDTRRGNYAYDDDGNKRGGASSLMEAMVAVGGHAPPAVAFPLMRSSTSLSVRGGNSNTTNAITTTTATTVTTANTSLSSLSPQKAAALLTLSCLYRYTLNDLRWHIIGFAREVRERANRILSVTCLFSSVSGGSTDSYAADGNVVRTPRRSPTTTPRRSPTTTPRGQPSFATAVPKSPTTPQTPTSATMSPFSILRPSSPSLTNSPSSLSLSLPSFTHLLRDISMLVTLIRSGGPCPHASRADCAVLLLLQRRVERVAAVIDDAMAARKKTKKAVITQQRRGSNGGGGSGERRRSSASHVALSREAVKKAMEEEEEAEEEEIRCGGNILIARPTQHQNEAPPIEKDTTTTTATTTITTRNHQQQLLLEVLAAQMAERRLLTERLADLQAAQRAAFAEKKALAATRCEAEEALEAFKASSQAMVSRYKLEKEEALEARRAAVEEEANSALTALSSECAALRAALSRMADGVNGGRVAAPRGGSSAHHHDEDDANRQADDADDADVDAFDMASLVRRAKERLHSEYRAKVAALLEAKGAVEVNADGTVAAVASHAVAPKTVRFQGVAVSNAAASHHATKRNANGLKSNSSAWMVEKEAVRVDGCYLDKDMATAAPSSSFTTTTTTTTTTTASSPSHPPHPHYHSRPSYRDFISREAVALQQSMAKAEQRLRLVLMSPIGRWGRAKVGGGEGGGMRTKGTSAGESHEDASLVLHRVVDAVDEGAPDNNRVRDLTTTQPRRRRQQWESEGADGVGVGVGEGQNEKSGVSILEPLEYAAVIADSCEGDRGGGGGEGGGSFLEPLI